MIYRGRITEGKIVLDTDEALPEGAAVEVNICAERGDASQEGDRQTIFDALQEFIGSVDDLPADMSINHDHYLYGTPKRT